ncbi:hypothetical protein FB45DRAFT_872136 [Roridomyces roridus]|uniref:Uncharacterized protein n=1 Tax=Roridomyces roridus TaxID=1738132 RepID=A0AAD7BEG5_9AGAR|nr:hypothetical protein FB45DRAFT_872136 [Roridomyces roridus]
MYHWRKPCGGSAEPASVLPHRTPEFVTIQRTQVKSEANLGIGTGKPAGIWGSTRTRTRGGCVPVPAGTGTGYPRFENTLFRCRDSMLPGLSAYPRVTGTQLGYPYPYPRRVNPSTRAGYPYPCRCLGKLREWLKIS